jgi:hypothetical protein
VLGGVKFSRYLNCNVTNVYPNNNKNKNNTNKVKSKPLELYELAGKKCYDQARLEHYILQITL